MMIFKRFIGLCTKISRDEKILGHHSNVLLRQKSYWDGKKIRVVRSNTLLCQKIYWDGGYIRAIILIPFFVKRVIGMRKF
jgi:hypothetical protein